MPLNDLQDIIDAINNGTPAEQLAFKNLIVNGMNAQDLADIIISSTRPQKESLATLVLEVENFLDDTNQTAIQAQLAADMAIANTWWDSTIEPTLLWNNTQSLTEQRDNIITDFNNIKPLLNTESDFHRRIVIKDKMKITEDKFKEVKGLL